MQVCEGHELVLKFEKLLISQCVRRDSLHSDHSAVRFPLSFVNIIADFANNLIEAVRALDFDKFKPLKDLTKILLALQRLGQIDRPDAPHILLRSGGSRTSFNFCLSYRFSSKFMNRSLLRLCT